MNRVRKSKNSKNTVPGGATSYSGPLVLLRSPEQQNIVEINCGFSSLAISSGTTIDLVFGTGLVTSSSDWASITNTFHEYRVLGMKYTFCPSNVAYGSAIMEPLISAVDRNAGTALGTMATAVDHESAQVHQWPMRPFVRELKMNGPEESVWTATGTSFSWGWVKIFGIGFPSNLEAGRSVLQFLVQLRGKG